MKNKSCNTSNINDTTHFPTMLIYRDKNDKTKQKPLYWILSNWTAGMFLKQCISVWKTQENFK